MRYFSPFIRHSVIAILAGLALLAITRLGPPGSSWWAETNSTGEGVMTGAPLEAVGTTSLLVAEDNIITLRMPTLPGDASRHVVARIGDLAWQETLDMARLRDGAELRVIPERPGVFLLSVEAQGQILQSVPLFVSLGPELGTRDSLVFRVVSSHWKISGDTVVVPICVAANVYLGRTSRTLVPAPVLSDTHVTIYEQSSQFPPLQVLIRRREVTSASLSLPLYPNAHYSLVPVAPTGECGDATSITWAANGPDVRLHARPARQVVLATALTPARLRVEVLAGQMRLLPPAALSIDVEKPAWVHFLPSSSETIPPGSGTAQLAFSAGRSVPNATICLRDATFGTETTATISFVFPWLLLLLSCLGGLAGLFVARSRHLLRQSWRTRVVDMIAGLCGGALLYSSVLFLWIPGLPSSPLMVAEVPAVCVGVVGGYLGSGVLKAIIAIWRLVPVSRVLVLVGLLSTALCLPGRTRAQDRDPSSGSDAAGTLRTYTEMLAAAQEPTTSGQILVRRGLLFVLLQRNEEAARDFRGAAGLFSGEAPDISYLRANALTNCGLALLNARAPLDTTVNVLNESLEDLRRLQSRPQTADITDAVKHALGPTLYLKAEALRVHGHEEEALAIGRRSCEALASFHDGWFGKAQLLVGQILVRTAVWREGREHLYGSLRPLRTAGEYGQLIDAYEQLLYAERDTQTRAAAAESLKAASFADSDYRNSYELQRFHVLAGYELRERTNAATADSLMNIADTINSDAVMPHLRIQHLLLTGEIALTRSDLRTVQHVIDRFESLQAQIPPMRSERVQFLALQMKLAWVQGQLLDALHAARKLDRTLSGDSPTLTSPAQLLSTSDQAKLLATMAEVFSQAGLYPEALDLCRQAMTLWERLDSPSDALVTELLYAYLWLQIDPRRESEGASTPEWRRSIDAIAKRVEESGDGYLQSQYRLVLAEGLLQTRQTAAAARILKEMTVVSVPEPLRRQFFFFRAWLAFEQGNLTQARDLLGPLLETDAASIAERFHYLTLLSMVSEREGDIADALASQVQAMSLAEDIASSSGALDFQASSRVRQGSSYDRAIALAWRTFRDEKTDDQAQQLLLLVLSAMIPTAPVTPTPATEDLATALTELADQHAADEYFTTEVGKRDPLSTNIDARRIAFRRAYLDYFSALPLQVSPPHRRRAYEVVQFLRERSATRGCDVRLYYVTHELGVIFVFSRGSTRGPYLIEPEAVKRLERDVTLWTDDILKLADRDPLARSRAAELSRLLFPDWSEGVGGRVEIIPDGILWDLPFESLIVSTRGTFLDEEASISYWTPASLRYRAVEGRALESTAEENRSSAPGIFFLDPELTSSRLGPLPGVSIFLPSLGDLLTVGNSPRVLVGAKAAEDSLYRRSLQDAQWWHFLTHGQVENSFEEQVGLLLSGTPVVVSSDSATQTLRTASVVPFRSDGFLSPREVQTMKLNVDFVFLQSCEAARGRISPMVGLRGLVSAFTIAGAHSVIASRWNVSARDGVTRAVGEFYRRVGTMGEESAEAALQDLRRSLRSGTGIGNRVYGWAAFSIYR